MESNKYLLNSNMLITDKMREKIIQNLEKTNYSFHYKEKAIKEEFLEWIKWRNKLWYITLLVTLVLIVIDSLGMYNFKNSLYIVIILGIWVIWKTISIFIHYCFKKFQLIEEYIKNKEIHEITEDDFSLEYYSLDDIKSEKGEKMITDYALWKYKKKK